MYHTQVPFSDSDLIGLRRGMGNHIFKKNFRSDCNALPESKTTNLELCAVFLFLFPGYK